MNNVSIRTRVIDQNIFQQAINLGVNPLIARIFAARSIIEVSKSLEPRLGNIDLPTAMADLLLAAKRIVMAIKRQEIIGLETDHDCDGQTSHAILYYNLTKHFKHPAEKIRSYIGHRLQEGYGLSWPLCNRIIKDVPLPSLIITADNGSTDEERIAFLKAHNIDVIVTDHHGIPADGYPKSSIACLNPTRTDCAYDPYIAGCMVVWLLMTQVRQTLIECELLSKNAPKLHDTLDFVAVGTIADCVSIAKSHNNRAVVNYGRSLIRKRARPCWQALTPYLTSSVSSQDLAFVIAPLLNSDGRLDTALNSVKFLLAEDENEARFLLQGLMNSNQERKALQRQILNDSFKHAMQQNKANKKSLCIYLTNGHSGVHGIAASKIKDKFGKPTIFLAPKLGAEGMLTGSIRGVDGFNVHEALIYINKLVPKLLISFGGHAGAGGITIYEKELEKFITLFETATNEQVSKKNIFLEPIIWTDGILSADLICLDTLDLINKLEPFGREFEFPSFKTTAVVKNFKVIGDGTHLSLQITIDNKEFNAVWFSCMDNKNVPVKKEEKVLIAFNLRERYWNSKRECQINIVGLQSKKDFDVDMPS